MKPRLAARHPNKLDGLIAPDTNMGAKNYVRLTPLQELQQTSQEARRRALEERYRNFELRSYGEDDS
ncbi:hypothetical protein AVEN_201028-1 [Araneus ventricosus]|uniref:Uncharacterized protein n=1 Tax=Araneus ventricosus TaxID=182803 RepID=A0A4Y2L026_ARAVE|nr:hypothetical protein AVEN_201028-1 [Araneus ventricosus]